MNPTSMDIKDILIQESSLGLSFGDDLFIGKEPATPDNVVTVFDTPGRPPQVLLSGKAGDGYFYPAVQIRVRNISYLDGWDLINRISEVLHGFARETYNGMTYVVVSSVADPFLLYWDDKDRAVFVVTFNVQRKKG